MLADNIKQLSQNYFDEIVAIRRHIHQHPELSFQERETAEFVSNKLTEWGIKHKTNIGGFGVVAQIDGNNPEKATIILRADMDALPITERTNCEYKSQNQGVSHACGHDAHTAMLLGCAKILNTLQSQFEGCIKFIFQPAEEKLPGGAKQMIESGILEDKQPYCILGQHVFPDLEVGKVGFCSGKYMASCDEITIKIKGKGGHAAYPERHTNTILIASKILLELQNINQNFASKENGSIVNFGKFVANGTFNVIPDEVLLQGTMRTFDEDQRKKIKSSIQSFSSEIAMASGATAEVTIEDGYPFLKNDIKITALAKQSAIQFLGNKNVVDIPQQMTSEDFAWYSQILPACFFRIGTANSEKGIIEKVHSSKFNIDEESLKTGMGLMSFIALNCLINSILNK